MKSIALFAVLAIAFVGCGTEADVSMDGDEGVGQAESALVRTGYCDIDNRTNLLTGKCKFSGVCSSKYPTVPECPAGAPFTSGASTLCCSARGCPLGPVTPNGLWDTARPCSY